MVDSTGFNELLVRASARVSLGKRTHSLSQSMLLVLLPLEGSLTFPRANACGTVYLRCGVQVLKL